jgi:hypothetical protein
MKVRYMDSWVRTLYICLLKENYEIFLVSKTPDGLDVTLRKMSCESDPFPSRNEFRNVKIWFFDEDE